jgi:tetratricopeptide (TPR) repeat protein
MLKNLLLYFVLLYIPFNAALAQDLNAEQIYSKINNAVATIYTFDANGKILSQGSGVVLNDKGWVVTNYHVFAGAEKIVVKHQEKVVEYTKIVGLDVEKDILILQIKDNTFQSIKIGNSDSLKVGQKIYAIGSPMGFENTMTEGIISGLRHYEKENKNFIQISAAISPGSSGGAIVNNKGELIAISTSTITEAQNLNFAIPVNDVLAVYKQDGIKQNEIDAAVYFYKGFNEDEKQNYDAAISNYEKAVAINPKLVEAYNNLGSAYDDKGDIETAIFYYKKAIAINPKFAGAYNNLGIAYINKGDIETAIIYYKKAIAINPEYAKAYNNLGVAYINKGDIETAIIYYKKAIAINPEYANAYYNLGVAYDNKGDFETEIIYHKKAIAINPEYADAYYNLGNAYTQKGDIETAIIYYKKTIDINPNYSEGYYALGLVYGAKGDAVMSQYYLEKAYKLDPSLRK